jgi:hypothetical protein
VAEPSLSAASLGVVVAVALVETTRLLAGCGEATSLAVLVDGVDDPVNAGVDADGLVLRVDKDDLVVLVGRVLVDPVRVEDTQVGAAAADTLLSGSLEGALVLELVDTLVGGLACRSHAMPCQPWIDSLACRSSHENGRKRTVSGTLRGGPLAATTANAHAVDYIALLGLVAETAGLVGARRARGAVNDVQLSELY